IPLLSYFFNSLVINIPFLDRLSLLRYIVVKKERGKFHDYGASVVIPCKNEEENIQGAIRRIPQMGKHLSSDFKGLDSLIRKGEEAAEEVMERIQSLYYEKAHPDKIGTDAEDAILQNPIIDFVGSGMPKSLRQAIRRTAEMRPMTVHDVREHVRKIYDVGDFRDVYAEVTMGLPMIASDHDGDTMGARITYHLAPNPRLNDVQFVGCNVVASQVLRGDAAHLLGLPLNHQSLQLALENILRRYRQKGFSLARVESETFNEATGILTIHINEGVIGRIDVQGGVRTQDSFVLREFPLTPGEVFQIDKANRGITNIGSTTLFEYVYLEVSYTQPEPVLTIRLKERPSQLVRLGLRVDNERNLQGSLDIRDENFHGLGTELGLNLNGGARNKEAVLEFKAHRLFNTYLTFNISAFYWSFDSYFYTDAPQVEENRWDRLRLGEYRDERYGGRLTFGTQLQKFGNATVDLSLQDVRIKNKENAEALRERYRLSMVRVETMIDSKDSYPFPTFGFGMNISYEFAFKGLGSQAGYNALRFIYESYQTWTNRHT
ncbi:MAG: BamA/TamA family outer membrane protein, partial [Bacteroidota bacterium]